MKRLTTILSVLLAACGGGDPQSTSDPQVDPSTDRVRAEKCVWICGQWTPLAAMTPLGINATGTEASLFYDGNSPSAYASQSTVPLPNGTWQMYVDQSNPDLIVIHVAMNATTNTAAGSTVVYIDNTSKIVQQNVYDSAGAYISTSVAPFTSLDYTASGRRFPLLRFKCGVDC